MAKRRTPRTKYPRNIERSYLAMLRKLILSWRKAATRLAEKHVYQFVKGGNALLKTDAGNDPIDSVIAQLNIMSFELQNLQPRYLIDMSTGQYVRALNSFSFNNVKMQTAVVGIDPITNNKAISDYVKGKIAENTSLIKSMQSDYANKLQDDIYRSITKGGGITDIANCISKRTNMAYNHARTIANDQTGSIISELDSYRSQKAGANSYIWRTMEDDRVRPEHEELDGKEFDYDDPTGGDDGDLPGEPINCRCVAEPVFDL